jgi:hypothetical protein
MDRVVRARTGYAVPGSDIRNSLAYRNYGSSAAVTKGKRLVKTAANGIRGR